MSLMVMGLRLQEQRDSQYSSIAYCIRFLDGNLSNLCSF